MTEAKHPKITKLPSGGYAYEWPGFGTGRDRESSREANFYACHPELRYWLDPIESLCNTARV